MKEIYLIRHGRQCSKLCNTDVSLGDEGRRQAELAGERLKNYGIEKVYTSDLKRAIETGEIIAGIIGTSTEMLSNIEEIHFGGFTGKTDEEIRQIYGEFQDRRRMHTEDLPFPDGGECGADVAKRAVPVIRSLAQKKEDRIAVVTHGGVIRSLCAHFLQTDQKNKLKFGIDVENCSISEFIYDEERDFFFLERFNDFAHLEDHPELLRKGWKTSLERSLV